MDFLSLEQSVWRRLQEETRPIALYGMGDGADKILAQFERLGEFLGRRFGGQLVSDQESPGSGRLLTYRVEQEEVVVSATGFFIARTARPYQPGQPGDPRRQQDLIRRMGEAFDAELAEGRHEAMFAKVPASRP